MGVVGAALRLRALDRFNGGVDDALWNRLSVGVRAEVDGLIADGRPIQAIAVMREHGGPPPPELRDCVDLLELRAKTLRR